MENLKEIRTPKTNKLYGELDLHTYNLRIKEGKIIRLIPITKEGVTLQLTFGNNPAEEIHIPPHRFLLQI